MFESEFQIGNSGIRAVGNRSLPRQKRVALLIVVPVGLADFIATGSGFCFPFDIWLLPSRVVADPPIRPRLA